MMTSDMPVGLPSLRQVNLDQYRLFVEHAREVFFQTDMEGVLVFLNPAWEQITGFSVAKSIGTSLFAYVYPDDRQRCKNLFNAMINGRLSPSQRCELRCLTVDQQSCWLQADL
ncbi:MAG: PAS domain-containing protein, partial [Cyanobacteria bacterium]|nr:PAS domain-containing protein [Cyanobacteriota bacterium]MDW8202890.1 PAS domain-containing protein [Cyanobacteriota bacterium SKYGB_h_bin112]